MEEICFIFTLSGICIPFFVHKSISNLKIKTLDLAERFVFNSFDNTQKENGLETVSSENAQQQLHLTDSAGSALDIG